MVWIGVALSIYALLLIVVTWCSVHPFRTPIFLSPESLGAPQEDVTLDCAGIKLRAWWVPCEGAKTVVIFGHGYMMNRSELAAEAAWLQGQGVACLLIDFRAHGRSGGRRSGFGVHEKLDLACATAFARARVPNCRLVLFGESMGAAASALSARELRADAVILDSCYSRLSDASLGWWRMIGGKALMALLWPTAVLAIPLVGFNPFRIDVAAALAQLDAPVLILHGDDDPLAPPRDAVRNLNACRGPHRLVWFPDSRHSEGRWLHNRLYRQAVGEFLVEHGLLDTIT